jgi:hypothetical protein
MDFQVSLPDPVFALYLLFAIRFCSSPRSPFAFAIRVPIRYSLALLGNMHWSTLTAPPPRTLQGGL